MEPKILFVITQNLRHLLGSFDFHVCVLSESFHKCSYDIINNLFTQSPKQRYIVIHIYIYNTAIKDSKNFPETDFNQFWCGYKKI